MRYVVELRGLAEQGHGASAVVANSLVPRAEALGDKDFARYSENSDNSDISELETKIFVPAPSFSEAY